MVNKQDIRYLFNKTCDELQVKISERELLWKMRNNIDTTSRQHVINSIKQMKDRLVIQ